SRDLKEEVFCPAIMDAASPAKQNAQESSSSIGVIVGVTVAILVVVAAVIVAVVIWKKKANNVKPQVRLFTVKDAGAPRQAIGEMQQPRPFTQTYVMCLALLM
ncbi:hypothetical protein DPMN_071752, partial [Dreissena polymorpha]